MSEHTPGPWEATNDAVPDGFTQVTVYAETDGERVATVFRTEANARLITAAPDLLEAAKALLEWADDVLEQRQIPVEEHNQHFGRLNHALRTAIVKAEGQEVDAR